MGNNVSSGQKETLLSSLSYCDAPKIAAVIMANPKLLVAKMDKTGNNLIHVAILGKDARPLVTLLAAVSDGYANLSQLTSPTRESSAVPVLAM